MKSLRLFWFLILAPAVWVAAVPTGWPSSAELPLSHPDEGEDLRRCLDCHDGGDASFPYARFSHTGLFGEKHSHVARTSQRVCEMCHRPSYCSDCHGVRVELKPSLKRHADPRGLSPHRGDYQTRHRIDGRLDPTKCFKCHGSPKTARSCAKCHG